MNSKYSLTSAIWGNVGWNAASMFVKPSADGSFSFSNVPPGRYRLTAWHKIAGYHKVDVVVPESGSVNVNISVPVDMEP